MLRYEREIEEILAELEARGQRPPRLSRGAASRPPLAVAALLCCSCAVGAICTLAILGSLPSYAVRGTATVLVAVALTAGTTHLLIAMLRGGARRSAVADRRRRSRRR